MDGAGVLQISGAWFCGLSSVPQGSGLARLRSSEDVSNLLLDHHTSKIEDAGFVFMDSPAFSASIKRNYLALIANQRNISISQSSIVKTNYHQICCGELHLCMHQQLCPNWLNTFHSIVN